ncbi:hypothetical protein TSAR_008807 [Trichomalopsis sarcophagae]|uniref:Uncharacterized protein n=1 Tax=Trichomalopsis sarcophagae TaxID=543379 RepID=A0A232ENC4_9HYME|nr:hypothetical protein TSAR_008807 [Trichomalopsis sarcophagae]
MDDQSVLLDQFPYHIVEFVAAGRKPKVRKTDIIATKWLQYDKQKKRVVTRYPPPPYDTEKSDELDSVLKELSDASSTWSTYTVILRGKAESGESDTEAEQRAANLIRQDQLRSAAKSFNDSLRKKDHLNPMIHLLYRTVYLVLRLSVTTFQTMEKVMGSLRQKSEHGANKRLLNAVLDCMTKISTDISSLSLDVKTMKLDISKIKAAHSSIVILDDIQTKIIKMNVSFSSDECRCFAVPLLH